VGVVFVTNFYSTSITLVEFCKQKLFRIMGFVGEKKRFLETQKLALTHVGHFMNLISSSLLEASSSPNSNSTQLEQLKCVIICCPFFTIVG